MDFGLTPEQKLIQQTATAIAERELAPRAAEVDRTGAFPWEGVQKLADAGLLGMALPPAWDGGGADSVSLVLATEAIARACGSCAFIFVTHVAASLGVLLGGTEGAKQKYLSALARGQRLAAIAVTEPDSGANPLAMRTSAVPDNGHYILNGSKVFITSGGAADVYLALARIGNGVGPQGLSLFLVDADASGFSRGRPDDRLGLHGVSSCELVFTDCRVPRENLLGVEGGGVPVLMAASGLGALGAAAISMGLAQAALDATVKHVKERVVAGQPIAAYQGVQFKVAEMSTTMDAMRALVLWAAHQRDVSPPGLPLPAFKAKLFASEAALEVIDTALQLHGGHGYSNELPLERYYRDARGATLHFSVSEALKDMLGKVLLGMFPMG